MATPDYLSLFPAAKRAKIIAAIKICEGEPGEKKAGGTFTDRQWGNVWIHRFVRDKLKEAEQKRKSAVIKTAQAAVDTDFPEE